MTEQLPSIDTIIRLVAATFELRRIDVLSSRRDATSVLARHVGMWLARRLTKHSLPVIGMHFQRDHTSVLYGIRKIDTMLETNSGVGQVVLGLMDSLTLPPAAA